MELNRAELSIIRRALRDYHARVRRGDIQFVDDEDTNIDYELEQLHHEVWDLRRKVSAKIKQVDSNGT